MYTIPLSALYTPLIVRNSVDLPAPLIPTRPNTSPSLISILRFAYKFYRTKCGKSMATWLKRLSYLPELLKSI